MLCICMRIFVFLLRQDLIYLLTIYFLYGFFLFIRRWLCQKEKFFFLFFSLDKHNFCGKRINLKLHFFGSMKLYVGHVAVFCDTKNINHHHSPLFTVRNRNFLVYSIHEINEIFLLNKMIMLHTHPIQKLSLTIYPFF